MESKRVRLPSTRPVHLSGPDSARAWRAFETELDAWAREGRSAAFWWRDDDASRPSAALDRLLGVRSRFRVPLALAVIPARLHPGLAPRLRTGGDLAVLQHGFAHANHAGAGEKSMELGLHRPRERVLGELARGFERLASAFEEGFVPVLVPPWNRIAAPLAPALPRLGLRGLSAFAPRPQPAPPSGLRRVDCHLDLIDWRGTRGCRDHARLAGELVGHLRARREGRADAAEPIGVLTHHLDHDECAWAFVERFLERSARHPAARWPAARDLFLSP